MARSVFPSAKWTHWEGPPQSGALLSAPHSLGHPGPASERPPTTLKGPKMSCLPLDIFPKSPVLTPPTSAPPISGDSGSALPWLHARRCSFAISHQLVEKLRPCPYYGPTHYHPALPPLPAQPSRVISGLEVPCP